MTSHGQMIWFDWLVPCMICISIVSICFNCLMTFPAAILQPTKPPKHTKLPHAGNKTYMGVAWQWWVHSDQMCSVLQQNLPEWFWMMSCNCFPLCFERTAQFACPSGFGVQEVLLVGCRRMQTWSVHAVVESLAAVIWSGLLIGLLVHICACSSLVFFFVDSTCVHSWIMMQRTDSLCSQRNFDSWTWSQSLLVRLGTVKSAYYILLYNAKNMSSKSSWYIAKEGSDEMDPKKRVMTVSLIICHLNSCDSRTLGDLGECGWSNWGIRPNSFIFIHDSR